MSDPPRLHGKSQPLAVSCCIHWRHVWLNHTHGSSIPTFKLCPCSFDVLRKLVLPDGSVLRALLPGRPTRDTLFRDVMRDSSTLLKVRVLVCNMTKHEAHGRSKRPLAAWRAQGDVHQHAAGRSGLVPACLTRVSPAVLCRCGT